MFIEYSLLAIFIANYIVSIIILLVDLETPKDIRTIKTKIEFWALFIPYATLLIFGIRFFKDFIYTFINFYKELK